MRYECSGYSGTPNVSKIWFLDIPTIMDFDLENELIIETVEYERRVQKGASSNKFGSSRNKENSSFKVLVVDRRVVPYGS